MASSDKVFVKSVQRGDRAAFDSLIELHQGAVYGYLRAHLLEHADAEDLCQEVFLRCYLGRAGFDSATLARPWLLGIARNVIREHVRRTKRRKEVAWTELCLELAPPAADEALYDERLARLPECLDSLGPSAREALDLRYGGSLRLSEIGQKLRRSEGAVKLLIFRARHALKHCLDRTAQDLSP